MEAERLRRAYVAWLTTFRWDWWVTLAFGYETSPRAMLRAVEAWLAPLPGAYAAVTIQRGPFGDRLHLHLVLGGIGRHALRASLLGGTWRRGSVDLKGYNPSKGAIPYMVHQADTVELVGVPRPYRPRKRGRDARLRGSPRAVHISPPPSKAKTCRVQPELNS